VLGSFNGRMSSATRARFPFEVGPQLHQELFLFCSARERQFQFPSANVFIRCQCERLVA